MGNATAATGTTYGVRGQSASTLGIGVYGSASAATGGTRGVYGWSGSTQGAGVFGYAASPSGFAVGVYGQSVSTGGHAVYGWALAATGTTYGVYGNSQSSSGYDFYAGGNGTNYGPFTGAHEVRLSGDFPKKVRAGTVVSVTGETATRRDPGGEVSISSTLPTVRLAYMDNDSAVLGVLVAETTLSEGHWYEAKETDRFATVNALGEGRVWVTDIAGEVRVGDYITTSPVPGYAQKQDDGILRNYTIGKVIESVDLSSPATETVEHDGRTYRAYLIAVVYTSG